MLRYRYSMQYLAIAIAMARGIGWFGYLDM